MADQIEHQAKHSAAIEKDIAALSVVVQNVTLEDSEKYDFVNTEAAISTLVDSLAGLPTSPPALYVDVEGVNLSRHGSVSILQLHIVPKNHTCLIDIHTLGDRAFTTPGSDGQTLKTIFESASIPKAFFDVRNDSDALHGHFGLKLAGIHDIQVMEYASRFRARFVNGLARCIERDLAMTWSERHDWLKNKEDGRKLFAPELGGSYEVLNVRPLADEIFRYCVQDVKYLPQLWTLYHGKLSPTTLAKVQSATVDRVNLSQSAGYNGKGRHMAVGPW